MLHHGDHDDVLHHASFDLQPRSITKMEVSFSRLELGATLPNPTLVRVVKMKYILVMYRDCRRRERKLLVGDFFQKGGRECHCCAINVNTNSNR